MIIQPLSGLPHARVEAKIVRELLRIAEPPDVADCSGDACGYGDVDTRQRHQATDCGIVEGTYSDIRLHDRQRLADLANQGY